MSGDSTDSSSNVSTQWDAFLGTINAQVSSPSLNRHSESPSSDVDEWASFLARVAPSPRASPDENVKDLVLTSEPEGSSSESQQPSTEDEYRPSPIPEPVQYIPSSNNSLDEGDGDFQHVIGEFVMAKAKPGHNSEDPLQMRYVPRQCSGAQ